MDNIDNYELYLKEGHVEAHVFGTATAEQSASLLNATSKFPQLREEITNCELLLEKYLMATAVAPAQKMKPSIFATIDFMERLKAGESITAAPLITKQSTISDYAYWLNQPAYQAPENYNEVFAKIISASADQTTAIIWVKDSANAEVHHDVHEHFLIVDGTCDIFVENDKFSLVAGEMFTIPLHKSHVIKVTSAVPCKAIMQRIAA